MDPQKCEAHSEAIGTLKANDVRQWDAIDTVRNRPPIYCLVIISFLTFVVGFVAGSKFSSKPISSLSSTTPARASQLVQGGETPDNMKIDLNKS